MSISLTRPVVWFRHRLLILLAFLCSATFGAQADVSVAPSQAVPPMDGQPLSLSALVQSPPLGLPAMDVPADNPVTEAKIALGRKLFFDRRLSFNSTLSCAMCHVPEQGFTQNEMRTPVGMEGRFVNRNAPALYNVGYRQRLFHDGREFSLENQVWQPLLKDNEMANPSVGFVIETITHARDYQGLFEGAFGRGPGMETIGQALASYQRGLLSAASPFDHWYFGDETEALGEAASRGFELFNSAGCVACHTIAEDHALLSDGQFHDTGIGYARSMQIAGTEGASVQLAPGVFVVPTVSFDRPQANDLGRYEATGKSDDRWQYLTPSLRNVAVTAPYMHDGSLPDLAAVLRFYNTGGIAHPDLDPLLQPLGLSELELEDLEIFLRALTSDNVEQLARDGRSVGIGDTVRAE